MKKANQCPPRSALHIAIGWNYFDIAKVLLQSGANPFEIDKDGVSSIQLIQKKLYKIEKEKNVNKKNELENAPLLNVLAQLKELMALCNQFQDQVKKEIADEVPV